MATESFTFGPFLFDRTRASLLRDGTPVVVGQRALALLEALLEADGAVVGKAALIERAWPGMIVEENNLAVQIAALRRTLGERPDGHEWIATAARVGYRLIRSKPYEPEVGLPSLAVLPFKNLTTDAEQQYFADGVVEDLITALSRFKNFAVIARSSSFVYKDRLVDVRIAAGELGVRYMLEGSVRRSGDRLRVSAHLIDTTTGVNLWAEKFDGAAADIFDFQDRITESVVGLMEPEIRKAEIERAKRKRPESLDAYDLFLQAIPYIYGMSSEGYATAIGLLERALALDPGFAPAMAYAAWAYEKRQTLSLPPLMPDDRKICLALARRAQEIGGDDPLIAAICGWVVFSMTDDMAGLEAVRRAVAANPNNLVALNLGGVANMIADDHEGALDCYLRAYRLSPGAPDAYWALTGIGTVEVRRGNYEAGVDWLLRSLATFNEWPPTYWALTAAYAQLDRMDEASAAINRLRELAPQLTMSRMPMNHHAGWNTLTEGLHKAGLADK